ncbi:hypothetical protein [Marinilactibacillus psychrotolerans]|nr:hypothetical protein [Marinilactibacillus psychrotolerans]
MIGVASLAMLGNVVIPSSLIVSASEIEAPLEVKETGPFQIIDDTMLYDTRDGYLYEFSDITDMQSYMNSNSFNENNNISLRAASSTTYRWEIIQLEYWNKSQVKKLAADSQKAAMAGVWGGVASAWMWKFPFVGASVATVSAILYTHYQKFVNAANKNQSMSHYREVRNIPGARGPVYRSTWKAFN